MGDAYNADMRFRLRTLLIAGAIGPLALAGMWYWVKYWPGLVVHVLLFYLVLFLSAYLRSINNETRA